MAESKLSSISKRIRGFAHKEVVLAVVAVVVMLAIYFSTLGRGGKMAEETTPGRDYCTGLETEVKNAIVRMSGDKNAQVIVNWETGVSSVIAYTETESQSSSSSSPAVVGGGPVVLKEVYPVARGAAVVVKGGDNVKLKLDIINMLSVLLGVSPEKIAVYGSEH